MEALLARTPDGARPADAAVLACKSVKNKLARICDIFEALLAAPPAVEYWPEWVARATALLSQYENLLREMQPLLLRFLLVPRLQDASGGPLASVENSTRPFPSPPLTAASPKRPAAHEAGARGGGASAGAQ